MLWLLISATALKKNWGKTVSIQAFADDFILILKAEIKERLVNLINKIINEFNKWIKNDIITLNWDKIEFLSLDITHTRNLPASDLYKFEGIKFQEKEFEGKEYIKYLGIILY